MVGFYFNNIIYACPNQPILDFQATPSICPVNERMSCDLSFFKHDF